MITNNLLSEARAKFEMIRLSKGKEVKNININSSVEDLNLLTENEFEKIKIPNSNNTYMYSGKKGEIFLPHKHKDCTEQIIILNKTGKIKVVTNNKIKIIKHPDSIFLKENEPHSIVWLEDTDILIIWNSKNK